MAVTFYVNWVHGSDTGTDYVTNTPEIPDALTIAINTSNVEVEAASPWNGQSLLDVAASWSNGFRAPVTSTDVPATQGRVLVEMEPWTEEAGERGFVIRATSEANFKLYVERVNGSPDKLNVVVVWNGAGSRNDVLFSDFPTVPFAVEAIYDTNNGTANQRLRARYWNIGSSAGSFTNSTYTDGSAAASGEPAYFEGGEYDGATVTTRFGRLIVSDDITEDLSTWSPGGGSPILLMGQPCL